uniref:Uncharacterized protein n=1 Tax=Arcella intermedia TaxID=1963864 RepID=A0A6B2L2Y3_9EUKA
MVGHTTAVTCFLCLEHRLLVSGSVDKSIRIWDLSDGRCCKVIKQGHDGGIKCLVALQDGRFCSGGNDKYLRVWTKEGELSGTIERIEAEENVTCMLAISNGMVIIASSLFLYAYRTDTLRFSHKFTIHREPVRCLVKINDETFASGSLDGVVVIWLCPSFSPLKTLNFPNTYFVNTDNRRHYSHSVNHLLVIGKRYLGVCIDKGFKIFDTIFGDCVMDRMNAHSSTVHCMLCISGGRRFITASSDAQIKLWGTTKDVDFTADEDPLQHKKRKPVYYPPILLGKMFGHTEEVSLLLKVTENSFLSGGHDKMIILWKDANIESHIRNEESAMDLLKNSPEFSEAKETQPKHITHHKRHATDDLNQVHILHPLTGSSLPPHMPASPSLPPYFSTEYALAIAKNLFYEQQYSINQIVEYLFKQGYSPDIVNSVTSHFVNINYN